MERLEIEFRLTQREITSYLTKQYMDNIFRLTNLVTVASSIVIFFVYLMIRGAKDFSLYIDTLIYIFSVVILISIIRYFARKKIAETIIRQNKFLSKNFKKIITEDGIYGIYESANDKIFSSWSKMYNYYETKYLYVFLKTPIEYLLIPKSVLKSEEEKDFFARCIAMIPKDKAL